MAILLTHYTRHKLPPSLSLSVFSKLVTISFPPQTKLLISNRSVLSTKCIILTPNKGLDCVVGPCHHGMARPQVADRGTASFM